MISQKQNIPGPFPQGRYDNFKGIEAEIQVFPEFPIGYHLLQIPVRRCNDPDIDFLHFVRPYFLDFPRLKDPQQLGLHK